MLSRVADAVYWMGRYLERAENITRLLLVTDDLAKDWRRLKDAGVKFVEDPTDYTNVKLATLEDPEGNLVQLIQFASRG